MPLYRKRVLRKKRMVRRKRRVARSSQALNSVNKVYTFRRLGLNSALEAENNGGPTTIAWDNQGSGWTANFNSASCAFKLTDLQASGDFGSLFDQYKIVGVGIRISQIKQGDPYATPQLFATIDNDNATTDTLDQLRQRNSLKRWDFHPGSTKAFKMYIRNPKCAVGAYQGALSTGYVSNNGWVDMSDNQVEHYGLKMFFGNITKGDRFSFETTYYLKTKGLQ